jgi:hypothetical protein
MQSVTRRSASARFEPGVNAGTIGRAQTRIGIVPIGSSHR